ncbi:unnamed protein product, partial [Polarella glacialis]
MTLRAVSRQVLLLVLLLPFQSGGVLRYPDGSFESRYPLHVDECALPGRALGPESQGCLLRLRKHLLEDADCNRVICDNILTSTPMEVYSNQTDWAPFKNLCGHMQELFQAVYDIGVGLVDREAVEEDRQELERLWQVFLASEGISPPDLDELPVHEVCVHKLVRKCGEDGRMLPEKVRETCLPCAASNGAVAFNKLDGACDAQARDLLEPWRVRQSFAARAAVLAMLRSLGKGARQGKADGKMPQTCLASSVPITTSFTGKKKLNGSMCTAIKGILGTSLQMLLLPMSVGKTKNGVFRSLSLRICVRGGGIGEEAPAADRKCEGLVAMVEVGVEVRLDSRRLRAEGDIPGFAREANPDSFKASGPKDSPDSAFAELQTPCRRPTSFRRRSAGQEVTTGSIPDSSGSPQKGKSAGGGAVSSSSRPTTAGEETASAASTFPTSRQSFRSFSWREEWTPGTDQDQSEPTVQKLESMAFPATLPVPAQQQSAHRTSSGQMPGLPPTLPAAAVQARSAAS